MAALRRGRSVVVMEKSGRGVDWCLGTGGGGAEGAWMKRFQLEG